ncbi:MAG: AraC family transcriptional regulator [Pseudomonadota bacterium]
MPSPSRPNAHARLYGMQERAEHLDFDIRFQGARDVLSRPHRHEYFQIQVSIEGGDRQVVGTATRPFTAGHLSFVLPYRMHVVPHPVGARYAIINFDQRFLWPELDVQALDLEDVGMAQHPELAPFLFQEYLDFAFVPADFTQIRQWLDALVLHNQPRGLGSSASLRGILLQLLGLTCARFADALHAQAARHSRRGGVQHDALQRALRHLREHSHEDLSLPDTATAVALSPNYLAHLLKKQTGRTFTELLTERRLEHARELLTGSDILIREIAYQSGFHDEAYFSRRFRQSTGLTPRQFRQQAVLTAAG